LEETDYSTIFSYSDGITCVFSESRGNIILDRDYKETISNPQEANVFPFSDGFAVAGFLSETQFYIDSSGKMAFGNTYFIAEPFSEGLAAVRPHDLGLFGYINKTGEMVIAPSYKKACLFGEGFACVTNEDSGWIIIDTSGKKVASIEDGAIDNAGAFSEGLCSVEKFDRGRQYWGYIDTTGKIVIDFRQYSQVTPFKNGIAQVLVGGKIGYIDKTGKYIWEPQ
jgi:hypothetical protein